MDSGSAAPEPAGRRAPIPALALGILLVVLFLTVQVVAFGLLSALGVSIDVDRGLNVSTALALGFVQLAGIAGAITMATRITTRKRLGIGAPRGSFDIGWRTLMPMGLLVITPTIGYVIATGGDLIDPAIDLPLALAVIALAILIAVNEELWFRGLIQDQLTTTRRRWFVVAASAALFGLPHAAGGSAALLNALGVTLAVGVPFAIVRMRCGSIMPLIAWHALIDIWAFLHTASLVPEGDPSLSDMAVALTLPALIAAGYLAWMQRSGIGISLTEPPAEDRSS